ncbi:MAG: ATP-binding cassette domain-containing protein, partial [Clostridiales bacterium]|nr:ATP-binding cassette domain-containing protein [Clostridiales bacterium]
RDYKDADVRAMVGVLIEAPGCFPNYSVWNNMMLQAANLGIENAEEEVRKVLKIVHMEGSASNKYKNCSLGMKQRIGIAFALLGNPTLLILDEPINGLDADGMRIMREVLTDVIKNYNCTVVISSHILGELEKIATHYGIVRGGKMIAEMTAEQLNANCRTYVALKVKDMDKVKKLLAQKYSRVETDDEEYIRIYDAAKAEEVVDYLYGNGIVVTEIKTSKIGLEEYYIDLMKEGR